jgi:copper chaperone CopZ
MRTLIMSLLLLAAPLFAMAQTAESGDITIKTSVVCDMCKDTIEKNLAFATGIKSVRVDVEKKEVHVKYNPKKTTAMDIKKSILALGYSADELAPTQEAIDGLHECCKPNSH